MSTVLPRFMRYVGSGHRRMDSSPLTIKKIPSSIYFIYSAKHTARFKKLKPICRTFPDSPGQACVHLRVPIQVYSYLL